jgi:hypothetical protein
MLGMHAVAQPSTSEALSSSVAGVAPRSGVWALGDVTGGSSSTRFGWASS